MKAFRNIVIFYTVGMFAALAAIIHTVQRLSLTVENVASYNEEELAVYKQVWEQMNGSFQQDKREMLLFGCTLWGLLFLAGCLLLFLVYYFQIRPVREMEGFASEIAKGNLDVPIPMHENNLFGSFTESFDLMREELRSAREREGQAEKAKREMVAELSHDLKTPVATIQATCEVMELKSRRKLAALQQELAELEEAADKGTEQKRTQLLESIRELQENLEKIGFITNKAETINQLVGSVFRATLDDMQEITASPEEYDSRMIEGFFENLKEYGNIIFDNHIPPCLVIFDKLRMEQVIDNIVGNSYKYAGTDVHVQFQETEGIPNQAGTQNRFIRITIRDEGPGVEEEELSLIAQKYYRGKNSKEKPGYGLGLYLVKWYMEKQGGGMEYHNDHGFVVELWVRKI